jgi:RNA polymerase sigma-70 factor, ECF subfamily
VFAKSEGNWSNTKVLLSDFSTLIDACLDGDQAAMARFVRQFQGPVFGLCWRMLRHVHDAEDAAQETLVRALRHLKRWDRSRPFEPWLLAIAANRCRTHRAKRRMPVLGVDLAETSASSECWPSAAANQLQEELGLVLQEIPARWSRAFQLFHEHELSYAEIAELLSVPVGTVKTWVHRARREIVAKLQRREVIFEGPHAVQAS